MQNLELGLITGVILSLIFEYVPGASGYYGKLEATKKRLVMLVLIVATAIVIGILSCANSPFQYVACSRDGIWQLVTLAVVTMTGNQTAHQLLKRA